MIRALLLVLAACNGLASAAPRLTSRPLDLLLSSPGNDVPIVDPPTRIAGTYKLERSTKDAHMFYFYFQARSKAADAPVVLWMTGGPGCSSELAVFVENGPYHLAPNMTLQESKYGWDVTHNMIYVDQPIGVGFSYSDDSDDDVYDEHAVAADMLDFLEDFFAAHPELQGNEFFVTGESYGGHYVPVVAHKVWAAKQAGLSKINIKGLAIGNGLTEPSIQFGAYPDFAKDAGLIGGFLHTVLRVLYIPCKWLTDACTSASPFECSIALQYCESFVFGPILMAAPGVNVYDVRKECEGALCYDFSAMDKYLNRPSVQKQLGVENREWVECSPEVYEDFLGDFMRRFDNKLPPMLEDGMRVLIYAGDQDLICNWVGNRRWVDALAWSGQEAWSRAADEEWDVDGQEAGTVTTQGPLWFVKVKDAGHMVPMDKPRNALELITHFTRNRPLVPAPSSDRAAAASLSGAGRTTPRSWLRRHLPA